MERFYATCPRGLEPVLARELQELGAEDVAAAEGGVAFAGTLALCYRANLLTRCASRILWQVAAGRYRSEHDLYRAAFDLPWQRWFDPSQTLRVDVSARRSPVQSLEFVTLRVKDAVCDRFRAGCGARPSVDTRSPDVRVLCHLEPEDYTLYLDTSGEALFKRGLRRAAGEAPLRENLAAGILLLAGWQPGTPLLDPMCGSGTFLVEAAMMALAIPPGAGRSFGFERLKNFDAALWRAERERAGSARRAPQVLPIWGADSDSGMVGAARENLRAAGLERAVKVRCADVLEIEAPAPEGVLVCNPPYGQRLGRQQDLAAFYPQFGDALKRRFAGWRAYVLSADPALPKRIRLRASRRTPLFNGALECRLFEYRMVAGSNRPGAKPGAAGQAAGPRPCPDGPERSLPASAAEAAPTPFSAREKGRG